MPVVAVVLAAGFGTRFDENNPKQLVSVGDKPIVCWSIEAFERNDRVSDIIVVVNERVSDMVNMLIDEAGYTKVRAVIPGGSERVDSTRAALDLLKQAGIPDGAKILIHDSVRPFVEQQSIDGCIDSLDQFNAATVAYASTDTILLTEDLGERKVVRSVPDRTNAFRAQTPQAFRFGTITKAYELATADPDFHPTDDTRVVVDYLPNEPVAIRSPRTSRAASTRNTPNKKRKRACTRCSPKHSHKCISTDRKRTHLSTTYTGTHAADQHRHLRFHPVRRHRRESGRTGSRGARRILE